MPGKKLPLAKYTIEALVFYHDETCSGSLYDPQTGSLQITGEIALRNNNELPCDDCGTVCRLPKIRGFNA